MNDVNLIQQLSPEELRKILREELSVFISNIPASTSSSPPQELLNIKGASRYLNLSTSAIYSLVHRKEIPYMKRARRLYFSKDELRQWVEEGRKPTQAVLQAAAEIHLSKVIKKRLS